MWRVLCLALAFLLSASAVQAADFKLERAVVFMRHGIRPPTKATVTPPGIAAQEWPAWSTPYGHLTAHGAEALKRLGAYEKQAWIARGLFTTACPAAGEVVIWSDTDERTIKTGDAMNESLFPGCGVESGHLPEGQPDALFHPLEGPVKLDIAKGKAAVLAAIGSIDKLRAAHRSAFDTLQRVLGCCTPAACTKMGLGENCRLAEVPADISFKEGDDRPNLTGAFDFASTAVQSLALEYAEGLPMDQVGWGRASRDDIETMMALHSVKTSSLQRPAYIGTHGASMIMARVLDALEGKGTSGKKLTLFAGHDTNIGDISGLLGFSWQVASYPPGTPPPGGGVHFELLSDNVGAKFVRLLYVSQTMDQMRTLAVLDAAHPPSLQTLAIPGCAETCPLADFAKLVRAKLAN